MLGFSDTKSDRTPDQTSVLRVNTSCPVRRPVRLCVRLTAVNQTIDSMQPPGIQILLIYTRTDVSCKHMEWMKKTRHFCLQNVKNAPAM
jgi:hypothetical protein